MASIKDAINKSNNAINKAQNRVNTALEKMSEFQVKMTSQFNKQKLQTLIKMQPQWKSNFEIIFYFPKPIDVDEKALIATQATGIAAASISTSYGMGKIVNLYAREVSVSFPSFTYERVGSNAYVSGIEFPDAVSFTFLENEVANVRSLLSDWQGLIGEFKESPMPMPGANNVPEFVFNDNQKMAKANCIILLLDSKGFPSSYNVKCVGLRPKSQDDIALAHSDGTGLEITLQMTPDYVEWGVLGGKIAGAVSGGIKSGLGSGGSAF